MDQNLYLNIKNIGLGYAKNVEIEWCLDIEKTVEFITENQGEESFIINYDNENKCIDFNESSLANLKTDPNTREPFFIMDTDYDLALSYSYSRIFSI